MNRNSNNTMKSDTQQQMPKQIVGLHYVEHPRPWWIPVGLEATHDKSSHYKPVFFGAEREWKNDDEGWQRYTTRKQRQNDRRNSHKQSNDNYGFDDDDYDAHKDGRYYE